MNRLKMYIKYKINLPDGRKLEKQVYLFLLLIGFFNGCISEFTPQITENPDMMVVEGMITDQPGQNFIKLHTSVPLGSKARPIPRSGCNVFVTDDTGASYFFREKFRGTGTYEADPDFHGIIGRYYTLHINAPDYNDDILTSYGPDLHNLQYKTYQSLPVKLVPVPPIDSIYYEREILSNYNGTPSDEGCSIYLDSHDPDNLCKYYRWEYTETWSFTLRYILPEFNPNYHCWMTQSSENIIVKSTSSFSEARVTRVPLTFISNETDRLAEKYSMFVNQYSLSESEYEYWEKLQNIVENAGGLYDITPALIQGNVTCLEDPDEKVLGFFSVSAVKSKRIFIKDKFRGIINLYKDCEHGIIGGTEIPYNIGINVWIIIDQQTPPPYRVITYSRGCADCTTRGTTVEPSFWNDDQ